VNLKDSFGSSALTVAARNGQPHVAEHLRGTFGAKADLNIDVEEHIQFLEPLHMAARGEAKEEEETPQWDSRRRGHSESEEAYYDG